MKIIVTKDYQELSKEAFKVLKTVLDNNPQAVLGLATGSSPIGLYQAMIEDHKNHQTSYQDVVTFNLDEYVGISKDHSQSYYTFMHEKLFNFIDIKPENINIPSGATKDLQQACIDYNEKLSNTQIDIQVLGIGSNAHIGFNEPGTSFESETHIVELKEKTRLDNQRFFDSLDDVPSKAITMGIKNIMHAKQILLLAYGKNKAQAIKDMVEGAISEDVPASILQKHDNVIVVLDEEAASLLKHEK